MRTLITTLTMAAIALFLSRVAEAKFDGSVPLLCVPIEITDDGTGFVIFGACTPV